MTSNRALKEFRAEGPDDLLQTQQAAVKVILKQLLEIASRVPRPRGPEKTREDRQEQAKADALPNSDSGFDRPHQVFTIDGARGAGKTYVLLTLAQVVTDMSREWWSESARTIKAKPWFDFVTEGSPIRDLASGDRLKELACIIRIIFPSDMEREETVMERIFVSMKHKLDSEIKDLESAPRETTALERLNKLRDKLVHEIVPGWHFSKSEGREVIIRDAIDYNDYSDLFEQEAEKSVRRIEKWREFLDEFLDHFRTAVLMVFLDDSDVHPDVTEDILRTARMFLNHPRAVTVLAGNIRSMRSLLLHRAMRQLGQSMRALSGGGTQTANDWRRVERRGVEDYLEKVLPQSQRIFIQSAHSDDGEKSLDDFEKVAKIPLNVLCDLILWGTRRRFLDHKFRLAISHSRQESDRPSTDQRRALEDYLSWWLFHNHYKDALAPRSARQIRTMRDYYLATARAYEKLKAPGNDNKTPEPKQADQRQSDGEPGRHDRRLIMALFENPANFSLIQQFNDNDINVATWLQDQYLDSQWVGPRRFHVNGRALDRGQFGYDYVRFRLDLGLAMPLRQNAEEAIPLNLLPVPHGRTHLRRFFHPQRMARRYRRLGVCQWIDHAVIPGNCIYFHDLDALPDRSLLQGNVEQLRQSRSTDVHDAQGGVSRRGLGQGYWETWLSHNWVDLIADGQDEYTYRYFTDVVCVSQTYMNTVPTSDMLRLLDPPSLVQEQEEGIYEFFWREEFSRLTYASSRQFSDVGQRKFEQRGRADVEKLSGNAIRDLCAQITFVIGLPDAKDRSGALTASDDVARPGSAGHRPDRVFDAHRDKFDDVLARHERIRMRSLALYAALINDVRRAWHAIRIYDLSMGALGRRGALSAAATGRDDERFSFAVLASQDRLNLYTAKDIRQRFDKSPWNRPSLIKSLLGAVEDETFTKKITAYLIEYLNSRPGTRAAAGDDAGSRLAIANALKDISLPVGMARNSEQADVAQTLRDLAQFPLLFVETHDPGLDEKQDYDRWVKMMRAVGRVLTPEWPDWGDHRDVPAEDQGAPNIDVKLLKKKAEEIKLVEIDGLRAVYEGKERGDDVRSVSRSTRNFVLLLYGLAPSLPALAHCQLMGLLREAELNYQAMLESNRQTGAGQEGELDLSKDPAAADTRALFNETKKQIKAWVSLVVSLAVALRYIRVRYLHLHIALWIRQVNDAITLEIPTKDLTPSQKGSLAIRDDGIQFIRSTLRYEPRTSGEINDENAGMILRKLARLFIPEGWRPADNLAIMPDVSSSTMFGDRWLSSTVESLAESGLLDLDNSVGIRRRGDSRSSPETDPLKADGVCQETEQWLWATIRCLKKFYSEASPVIALRLKSLPERSAPPPVPGQAARKRPRRGGSSGER